MDLYAKELMRLERLSGGELTADQVVEAARPANSPLHNYFEWSDTKAARAWRKHQAGTLIAYIRIPVVGEEGHVTSARKYVNVRMKEDGEEDRRVYVSHKKVVSDPELLAQVIDAAQRHLVYWREQYGMYRELARASKHVQQAIDKIKKGKQR